MPAATRCSIAKARAPEIGWLAARGLRIEREQADPVAVLQRDEGGEQGGRDGAVDPRHAGDRLAHRPAGVDRHDDVVVALGAIFLGDQHGVAGRGLPVDRAPVHPLAIVGERLELGALADLELGLDAEHRLLVHHLHALVADRADVGRDRDRLAEGQLPLLPDQAERPGPADPDAVEPRRAAPVGASARRPRRGRPLGLGRGAKAERRADRPGDAERELDPGRRAAAEPRPRRHREGLADADRARPFAGDLDAAQAGAGQRRRRRTSASSKASSASPPVQ